MDFVLEKELENVRVVDTKRDYWFIRSYSGELFEHFYSGGYVGLGLNTIPYQYIKEAPKSNQNYDTLLSYINLNTSYRDGEATKWTNQLLSFEHEVKIGDIIITPSKNSSQFAFGIVKSDTYLEKDTGAFKFKDSYESYPEKRKRVDWLKIITKEVLQGEFRNLMSTHQAITNANTYKDIVEGNLSSLYIRDERIYLTIRINQDEDINAFILNRFLNGLTFFYKEFCRENGIEDNEDLTIKIKLQSRGKMALSGIGLIGGLGLAGLIALSNNAEFTAKYDPETNSGELSAKSDGFLKSLSEFLDSDQRRRMEYEMFQDSLEKLRVKPVSEGIEDATLETDSIKVEELNEDYVLLVNRKEGDTTANNN